MRVCAHSFVGSSASTFMTPTVHAFCCRLLGTTLPCYTEVTTVKDCDVATDARQIQPEVYTEEHERLLGNCLQEWELFKDGFREDGTRIYDSERGKTCHQCRYVI